MADYMEGLSAALVAYPLRRTSIQETVVELIVRTDSRCRHNEQLRTSELQRLRESFYRAAIAEHLIDSGKFPNANTAELLIRAQEIREKRGYNIRFHGKSPEMRTPEEERLYGTLRVRWSNLLAKAGVAPADRRGGDTSQFRRA